MHRVVGIALMEAARGLMRSRARYGRVLVLMPLGAYARGADPVTDRAVDLHPQIECFLRQGTKEGAPFAPCVEQLEAMMA